MNQSKSQSTNVWHEIERLYLKVLRKVYGTRPDRGGAAKLAPKLRRLLRSTQGADRALLGQDTLSILAELQGKLDSAAAHRRQSIDMLRRLLRPGSPLPHYDWSDVCDRLYLL